MTQDQNRWRHPTLETLILFAVCILLNLYICPDRPAFIHLSPHPYLIPILLLSCRYGLGQGLAAAATATVLLTAWGGAGVSPQVWQDISGTLVEVLAFGLAALIPSTLIGSLRERLRLSQEEHAAAATALAREQRAAATLLEVNNALQERILSSTQANSNLGGVVQALSSLSHARLIECIPQATAEALGASMCSLYLVRDNELVLASSTGWPLQNNFRQRLSPDRSLLCRAWLNGSLQETRDFLGGREHELEMLGESILAAPLILEDGQVLGVINVESLPFERITHMSALTCAHLGQWFGSTWRRIELIERLQERTILDAVHSIYTRAYLQDCLQIEFARSRMYSLPYSLLLLRLEGTPPFQDQELLTHMISVLKSLIRPIDILALNESPWPLAVLLTTCSREEAMETATAITAALDAMLLQPGGDARFLCGIGSYNPSMTNYDDLIHEAEVSVQ